MHLGEFLLQVRIFRPAGAVEVLTIAGLRHEAVHDAVERHVVVIALARELLDALGVLGRKVRPQLDDDAALGGVDDDGVGLVEAGRQGLRERRHRKQNRGKKPDKNCENSDHDNSGSEMRKETRRYQANFALSWAATSGGTKAETSPPMAAIWRTKVAGIGRAMGETRRKNGCTPGALAPLMPAGCIS